VIVDSSALIAVLRGEPTTEKLLAELTRSTRMAIASATLLEASIVADSARDPLVSARFDDLLHGLDIEIVPVTAEHAAIARQAYRDYGKGSGHPAALNFGDCFSYALAKERREPLLYVGQDFVYTDIRSALDH
jgi:ribonuclease VapC